MIKMIRVALKLLAVLVVPGCSASPLPENSGAPMKPSLYDYSATDVADQSVPLSQYRGKVALVVNTASKCGFTYQYKNLEEIYQRFKDQGLVVLAFPSNDFGEQEPGGNAEIKKFCELKYQTTFPVFSKAPVSGAEKQEVYRFLTQASPSEFQGDPGWNFVKFLVDKNGQVVGRYSSMTSPSSDEVVAAIERELSRS